MYKIVADVIVLELERLPLRKGQRFTRSFGDRVNGHQYAFEREGLFGGDEKQVYIKISTVSGDIRIDKAS